MTGLRGWIYTTSRDMTQQRARESDRPTDLGRRFRENTRRLNRLKEILV
jgi:hypothetical protein